MQLHGINYQMSARIMSLMTTRESPSPHPVGRGEPLDRSLEELGGQQTHPDDPAVHLFLLWLPCQLPVLINLRPPLISVGPSPPIPVQGKQVTLYLHINKKASSLFQQTDNQKNQIHWAEMIPHSIPTICKKEKRILLTYLIISPYSSHLILSSGAGNIGYDFLACLKKLPLRLPSPFIIRSCLALWADGWSVSSSTSLSSLESMSALGGVGMGNGHKVPKDSELVLMKLLLKTDY